MYKTVRHGENSLQYKILAQQEEGVASIKYRKSPRTVTAKLITVIILLIIGIIASAVLVPLVLTNDFIALTGTFQKFSVSSLRRSHSGNHVVVIAKKPYGWNAPHSSAPPRLSNASQSHSTGIKKSTVETEPPTTVTEPPTTTQTTKTTAVESLRSKVTPDRAAGNREMAPHKAETSTTASGGEREPESPSQTPAVAHQQKTFRKGMPQSEVSSSTAEPMWLGPVKFEPVQKWGLGASDNFINGMSGVVSNPVSLLGSFLFVLVVVVMFFILRKSLPKRRVSAEKESAESKEHKTRLLKPSVSSDHDED